MYERKNFCNMAEIESQIYPFRTSFPSELLLAGEIFLISFRKFEEKRPKPPFAIGIESEKKKPASRPERGGEDDKCSRFPKWKPYAINLIASAGRCCGRRAAISRCNMHAEQKEK